MRPYARTASPRVPVIQELRNPHQLRAVCRSCFVGPNRGWRWPVAEREHCGDSCASSLPAGGAARLTADGVRLRHIVVLSNDILPRRRQLLKLLPCSTRANHEMQPEQNDRRERNPTIREHQAAREPTARGLCRRRRRRLVRRPWAFAPCRAWRRHDLICCGRLPYRARMRYRDRCPLNVPHKAPLRLVPIDQEESRHGCERHCECEAPTSDHFSACLH